MHRICHVRFTKSYRALDLRLFSLLAWLLLICEHADTRVPQSTFTTTTRRIYCIYYKLDGTCLVPTRVPLFLTDSPYDTNSTTTVPRVYFPNHRFTKKPPYQGHSVITSALVGVPLGTVLLIAVIVASTRIVKCRREAQMRAQESSRSTDGTLADAENQINQYRSNGLSNAPPTYTDSLVQDILTREDETTPTVTTNLTSDLTDDGLPSYQELMDQEQHNNS